MPSWSPARQHAREHGSGELLRWDGEGEASDYLYARSRELGPRPDGLGVWAQDGTDIAFLLERNVTGWAADTASTQ